MLPQKIRKGKHACHLVDEEDEGSNKESIPHREYDDLSFLISAKKLSLDALKKEKGEEESNDADLGTSHIKISLGHPAFLHCHKVGTCGGESNVRDPVSEGKQLPTYMKLVGVKGKVVVTKEQVAHSLIDLSKKKRTTNQFILARHDQTPPDLTTRPSSQPDDDTSEKVIHESSSTSDSE
ncbi:hypothetical protein Tco_0132488 [Tanacetum coccineum]